jgi:D-amino-acid oxidase
MRVSVIGGGVIGLTVAHELAVAGHQVTVVAASGHETATSSVAAAIWFPYAVTGTPRITASGEATLQRLVKLAGDPATGVRLREGTVLARSLAPDMGWTASVPDCSPTTDVPSGATGIRCALPVAVTDVYLNWLYQQVSDLGVRFETRAVTALNEITDADAVVIAAGLGSAALVGGDDEAYPIRGQVVRLANPGLTEWWLDDDNPEGLTYVVPRDGDVVCGGTEDVGSWDATIDPEVETAILARAVDLVPALAGQPVLSRAVGLRPGRSSVRLELLPGQTRPTVACYGHGGSGFTLSWGEAADVVRLLTPLSRRD